MTQVYVFSNGIRLRRRDMVEGQLRRYAEPGNPNLHEPVEEDWLLRSFDRDRPERSLFLDVGAGVGYYSFLIKKRWPDAVVVAFEALPRHADALDANRVLNGLTDADVTLVRAAVGTTSGPAAFVDQGYGSGLATGSPHPDALTVETRSLRAVLEDLPSVHLMKMDIQGAELDVLTAAGDALVRCGVRHVVIGTHGPVLHAAVVQLLARLGYTIAVDDPCPPMQPDGLVVAHLEPRA
jgi:FkbM family methyltransferase